MVYLPLPSHKKGVQWKDQIPGNTAADLVSIWFIAPFGKGSKRGKIHTYHGPLVHKTGISFIDFIKDMIVSALIVIAAGLHSAYAKIKALGVSSLSVINNTPQLWSGNMI